MTRGLEWLLIAWGVVTSLFLILLILSQYADEARGRPALH